MWVKICGIRDAATARDIAVLRPDAIGINFFAKSPRAAVAGEVRELVAALPDSVEPIGLFVNHSVDEVDDCCRTFGLQTVQIHGDEPVEFLARLVERAPRRKIIRAVRLGEDGIQPVVDLLASCRQLGVELAAVLVDAAVEGTYGGTGRTAPWKVLASGDDRPDWPPLILAGGLVPENVAEAIRTVRPWGVDVASGVESSPACKDLSKVAAFIEAARNAVVPAER